VTVIQVKVKFFSFENGGRPCLPEGSGYSPHFVVQGSSDYLGVRFLDTPKELFAEQAYIQKVQLIYEPDIDYKPLSKGKLFSVLEGGKTVAVGEVL